MKAKISASLAAMLLALGLAVGCSKSAPNGSSDAQIIGEVATKVQNDATVQTKAVAIQSNNGVVTLSGQVSSDAERNAIASDAAQVAGVKTVVNNLTVANAAAQQAPAPAPVEPPKHEEAKSSARHHESYRAHNDYHNVPAPAPAPSNTVAQTTPAPVVAPVTPPPPPKPLTLTIPEGTQIAIRLIDPLDTSKNQVGDRFRASIAHSFRINDQVAIPTGADVEGRVVDVKDATHFSGGSV